MVDMGTALMRSTKRIPTTALGERMRWAIEHSDHSQASLARAIGVTAGSVSQWCIGDIDFLRPENLFAAARALRVEPEWLGTGNGPRTRTERLAPDVNAEIARIIDRLPQDAQAPLLALLVAMIRRSPEP